MRNDNGAVSEEGTMKLTIAAFALGSLLSAMASADIAYESWPNIAASPAPVKDEARDGYWWWPQGPSTADANKSVWGNHGVVYGLGHATPPIPTHGDPGPPPIPFARGETIYKFLASNILFDRNKSILMRDGKAEIDSVVAYTKTHRDIVVVEGHTDDTENPTQADRLATARAEAVKKYMVEQGVPENRIRVKSAGAKKPALPNDSDANRKINRRVVFDFILVP